VNLKPSNPPRTLTVLWAGLLFLSCASGATYYVGTNGSDSNPGTQAAPFRHLSKGAAVARAGDTVIVLDGTYDNESVVAPGYVVTLYYSGTAGNPITFKAQNRGQAILDAMNTTTDTSCNGAYSYFNLYNASFIVIDGFVIQRACNEGIHSNDSAHDITIRHNEIRNIANHTATDQIGRDGIYINGSQYNFTFDGNVWHDIGRTDGISPLHFDHAIYSHGQNIAVINNVFYHMNRGWSIQLADGASNWLVANNTFAFGNANGEDGQIMFWGNNPNIVLRNNTFYYPNNYAMTRYAATTTGGVFDHNVVYPGSGIIADTSGFSITSNNTGSNADPKFVNASAYDFHSQSDGAGIDSGTNLDAVSMDLDGAARPQGSSTDAGAYEYGPSQVSMPPPLISGVFASGIVSNSATVNWSTDEAATSYVQFGLSSYTSTTPVDSTMVNQHSVVLSNLSASSLYHFRVGSTNSAGGTTLSPDYTVAASGEGAVQTFRGNYSASNGYSDLKWVQMLLAVAPDGGGQPFCYVHYDVQGNQFWLYSDVQGGFVGPIAPGTTSNLLQGSLCALNTSTSTVSGSGDQLTLDASLVFKQALTLNVYTRAYTWEGTDTGWVQQGNWTAAAASLGTMSVSPSSGGVLDGTEQTFTLTYPDTLGFTGVPFGWEEFLVAVASNGGGQPFCYLHYDRAGNGLWMYSSDVGYFLGPVTPGTVSNTLNSSACSVNTGGVTVQNAGGTSVLSVPVTLKGPMVGSQKLFERAPTLLNVDTGFVQTGTLNVN
jgi:hypothetical protein